MNRLKIQLNAPLYKARSSAVISFTTYAANLRKSDQNRQGKILSKLIGNRVAGSKKRWVENPTPHSRFDPGAASSPLNFTQSTRTDHGSNRRTTVLNKLFMTHITDLLATGEASPKILGKGLQITRVKITPNFQVCNVYWTAKEDAAKEVDLEAELQKCGGILRHELSQLRLMGEVPRIHFVRDKTFANLVQIEAVLKTCDFGEGHKPADPSYQVKRDLYPDSQSLQEVQKDDEDDEEPMPEMRHDVFGLDHRGIMLKILAKMKKSEQAWQNHNRDEQVANVASEESTAEKLNQLKEEIAKTENDKSFEKLLSNLSENKRFRDRRYRRADDGFYKRIGNDESDPLEDGDYIDEDFDEKK